MAGESSHRHRIVKPLHGRIEIPAKRPSEKRLHEATALFIYPGSISPTRRGQLYLQHNDVWIIGNFAQRCLRRTCLLRRIRRFDEKNAVLLRESRKKLLRALPDPVPSQMGMDNDRIIIFVELAESDGVKMFHHLPYKRGPSSPWRSVSLLKTA